eukprot:COSAG02_NODE_26494_length_631_cov_1.667293_1_plen_79_part_01
MDENHNASCAEEISDLDVKIALAPINPIASTRFEMRHGAVAQTSQPAVAHQRGVRATICGGLACPSPVATDPSQRAASL